MGFNSDLLSEILRRVCSLESNNTMEVPRGKKSKAIYFVVAANIEAKWEQPQTWKTGLWESNNKVVLLGDCSRMMHLDGESLSSRKASSLRLTRSSMGHVITLFPIQAQPLSPVVFTRDYLQMKRFCRGCVSEYQYGASDLMNTAYWFWTQYGVFDLVNTAYWLLEGLALYRASRLVQVLRAGERVTSGVHKHKSCGC
ncbi:hypothetical protein Tco_1132601 [Tanacetum coccineum]|uniref:Uncharacterized protein n=1 Tax=Tanacetum coccineum TaxID=301880 RepID=A0ABQ5JE38_9ASTR